MKDNVNLIKRTRQLKEDFLIAHNKLAQNKNVSFESRGLLLMLLSLPTDWVLHKSWIMKEYGVGRDKLNRMFKELRDNGYLVELDMIQAKDGRFKGRNYMIYDSPQNDVKEISPLYQNPSTAEPITDEPSTVNSTPKKNISKHSTYTNKKNISKKETEENFSFFCTPNIERVRRGIEVRAGELTTEELEYVNSDEDLEIDEAGIVVSTLPF